MIPPVFHRIWFSDGPDDPVPDRYEGFWEAFGAMHPAWELVTWTDPDEIPMRRRDLFDFLSGRGKASYGYRADIARYELIAAFGGVYIDTDVEPLGTFHELRIEPFVAWCSEKELDPAVFGAPANHPAAIALVDALPTPDEWERRWSPPGVTGPSHMTRVWRHRDDVRRLPAITFFPVHWSERQHAQRIGPYPAESLARHHWGAGWKA